MIYRRTWKLEGFNDSWTLASFSEDKGTLDLIERAQFLTGLKEGIDEEMLNPETQIYSLNITQYEDTDGVVWDSTYGDAPTSKNQFWQGLVHGELVRIIEEKITGDVDLTMPPAQLKGIIENVQRSGAPQTFSSGTHNITIKPLGPINWNTV